MLDSHTNTVISQAFASIRQDGVENHDKDKFYSRSMIQQNVKSILTLNDMSSSDGIQTVHEYRQSIRK